MENEQYLSSDPQKNKSLENEEQRGSVSKKARRKRRVRASEKPNQEQQQPHVDESAPPSEPKFGSAFIFPNPLYYPERISNLPSVEEKPKHPLPQRRQGRGNQLPSPKRRPSAK